MNNNKELGKKCEQKIKRSGNGSTMFFKLSY